MRHCAYCKVGISSNTEICPLCRRKLEGGGDAPADYPSFEPAAKGLKTAKAVSLTACFAIAVCVAVNLLTWHGELWCAVVSACILYAWWPGLLSFSKRVHLGWKLTAHAIAIPLLLVAINMFASSAAVVSRVSWAVSYTMPAIFIGFITLIGYLAVRWKHKRRDYLLYLLSLCLCGFIPLTLVLCGVAQPAFMSIAAAAYSFLTIILLVVYAKKLIGSEIARKFHI